MVDYKIFKTTGKPIQYLLNYVCFSDPLGCEPDNRSYLPSSLWTRPTHHYGGWKCWVLLFAAYPVVIASVCDMILARGFRKSFEDLWEERPSPLSGCFRTISYEDTTLGNVFGHFTILKQSPSNLSKVCLQHVVIESLNLVRRLPQLLCFFCCCYFF